MAGLEAHSVLSNGYSRTSGVCRPMRLLFVKEHLAWPRSAGHDVHCFHMMRALARQGHAISLVTATPVAAEAREGVRLGYCATLPRQENPDHGADRLPLTGFQERFRSYWGIDVQRIQSVGEAARHVRADAVIAVGLNVLPYLAAVGRAARVWYAADEWVWHHLSLVRPTERSTWNHLAHALVKGLYERAYGPILDRVWVVSKEDQRAMRWVTGVRHVDVLPNGVDGDYFAPRARAERHNSCVFWGRLDFEPNIQALEWFCRDVWPRLRRAVPDANFAIYGFKPTPSVRQLAGTEGVTLAADLPDLRDEISRQALVVLPFVSGGGIKNKLLEAASLAKAVVCTPRALGGLRGEKPPLVTARTAAQWAETMQSLWSDENRRRRLGQAARSWVLTQHTWEAAARAASIGLRQSRGERSRQ
jgi:glycosyltransferase involved in cell wall biosynthesis